MIPVEAYVLVSVALFCLGVLGLLLNRNALRILISVELILNGANVNFLAFGKFYGSSDGAALTLFTIALAAAEAAIGLAIFILTYRHVRSVNLDASSSLRW